LKKIMAKQKTPKLKVAVYECESCGRECILTVEEGPNVCELCESYQAGYVKGYNEGLKGACEQN
jgi:DNA replicative helicase MCM subunit Mcm2 (Cdc46/Mcm family)